MAACQQWCVCVSGSGARGVDERGVCGVSGREQLRQRHERQCQRERLQGQQGQRPLDCLSQKCDSSRGASAGTATAELFQPQMGQFT